MCRIHWRSLTLRVLPSLEVNLPCMSLASMGRRTQQPSLSCFWSACLSIPWINQTMREIQVGEVQPVWLYGKGSFPIIIAIMPFWLDQWWLMLFSFQCFCWHIWKEMLTCVVPLWGLEPDSALITTKALTSSTIKLPLSSFCSVC